MTRPPPTTPDTKALAAHAAAVLAERPRRVQSFLHDGHTYWVKARERPSLRMRLQKGDPAGAFHAERQALLTLALLGAPVPPIVAEGPGFFVTPDCGPNLTRLLDDADPNSANRLAAFGAAARGLAEFHARSVSHGRPSIKDILWDGSRARFIDFERYTARRNTVTGHAEDVVILLFSAFAATGRACAETDTLEASYRAADPGGVWEAAERRCRRLRWLGPLTWPVRRLRASPEFKAIPLTLRAFGAE